MYVSPQSALALQFSDLKIPHSGSDSCQTALARWELQLTTDLVRLEARVLPSPRIYFGDGGTTGSKLFWDPKTEAPKRKFLKPVIMNPHLGT